MPQRPNRETVDLSAYPELVVIYLGMRVNTITGVKTVLGFGQKISSAVAANPDGLLLLENLFYSLRHVGMRQYWRDLNHWSDGPDPNRTVFGGRHFSATAAAPDSGMRRTFGAAVSKRCTWTCRRPSAWLGSRPLYPRAERCFRHGSGRQRPVRRRDRRP